MLLEFFVYLNNCNCEKCLKKSQNCDNYTIVKRRKRGKKRGERVRKGMEKYVDKYVENVEKLASGVKIKKTFTSFTCEKGDKNVINAWRISKMKEILNF